MLEHIAFLVPDAALHGYCAKDLVDGRPQGFAAIQDDQDALLDVKAAADEVGEQMDGDGLVLCRAIPEPERDLDPVGADAQSNDTAAALQLDTVEHQRRQAHIGKRPAHQRCEMLAGASNELAADRRLRCRALRGRQAIADGLTGPCKPAGGNTREHLLEHDPAQRVTISEIRIGRQRHLVLPVGAPSPWTLHSDPPAAQGHLSVFVAMTDSGALFDRCMLCADDLIELGLHHLAEHTQPDADAQRQQPVLRGPSELPERLLHPQRQTLTAGVLLLHYGLHGGSLRLDGLVCTRHGPNGTGRGERDRHLQTSTSYGTTSSQSPHLCWPITVARRTRTWGGWSSLYWASDGLSSWRI